MDVDEIISLNLVWIRLIFYLFLEMISRTTWKYHDCCHFCLTKLKNICCLAVPIFFMIRSLVAAANLNGMTHDYTRYATCSTCMLRRLQLKKMSKVGNTLIWCTLFLGNIILMFNNPPSKYLNDFMINNTHTQFSSFYSLCIYPDCEYKLIQSQFLDTNLTHLHYNHGFFFLFRVPRQMFHCQLL